MAKFRSLLIIAVLIIAGIALFMFSGRSGQELISKITPIAIAPKTILSHSLLEMLPENYDGMIFTDYQSKPYQKYKDTPVAKLSGFNQTFKDFLFNRSEENSPLKLDQQTMTLIRHLIDSTEDIGAMLLFVDAPDSSPIQDLQIGGLLETTKDESAEKLYQNLVNVLRNKNFSPVEEDVSGVTIASLSPDISGDYKPEFLFGKSGKRLAFALQKSEIQRLLGSSETTTQSPPEKRPDLKDHLSLLHSATNYGFGFLDVSSLSQLLKTAPAGDIELSKLNEALKNIQTLVMAVGMDSGPYNEGRVQFQPESSLKRKIIINDVQNYLPEQPLQDSLLHLYINTGWIQSILSLIPEPGQTPEFQQAVSSIEDYRAAKLSLRGGNTGELIPEVIFELVPGEGKTGNTLRDQLTSLIGASFSSIPLEWKPAEKDGVAYQSIQTPLGVGLFFSEKSGRAIFSTTQKGVLDASGQSSQENSKKIQAEFRKIFEQDNILGSVMIDFEGFVDSIRSAMGMLAMFTGGANFHDLDTQLNELKKVGSALIAANYTDNMLSFKTRYQLPEKQG